MTTEKDQMIRVLIVDDQALVRRGFRMLLEEEPDIRVVGEAHDGDTAIRLAQELQPDIILMDVRMPGMDGITATRTIAGTVPSGRVIVLTTFDLDEFAFGGLRAGASGFLLKTARPEELLSAIRAVAAGDAVISGRITMRMLELFGNELPTSHDSGDSGSPLSTLTAREREILIAVAEGLTNTEITQQFHLTESTVKTHVGRVLAKLHARDRVQLVIFAHDHQLTKSHRDVFPGREEA
jgi:DNA-binding NarL/FixJ family response regulator